MPCIFMTMSWPDGKDFNPLASTKLYQDIADAVGLDVNKVQIHINHKPWEILQPNGSTTLAEDVHATVEWHERAFVVKEKITQAIHEFCQTHGLDSDVMFDDHARNNGAFFVNGKPVVGAEYKDTEKL